MSGGRRFAPGWRPEPNEVLDGGIVEDDLHEGKFGPYRTLTIEREDGTQLAVHAYHSVLADELEGIGVGDRVRIT